MARLSAQLEEWRKGALQNLICELENLLFQISDMHARAVILRRVDKLKDYQKVEYGGRLCPVVRHSRRKSCTNSFALKEAPLGRAT